MSCAAPDAPPPCRHEGPVNESAWCGCEDRHVRWCFHPVADWDRCVRGPASADPELVRPCPTCPYREA
jgi:hypothetical protein